MTIKTTILTHDSRWKGLRPTVMRAAEAALRQLKATRAAVTVVLADDAEVQTLNATYRHKNKPTNVLSFPDGEKEGGITHLGDIILSYDTIFAEASAQGKTLKAHLTHLVIHGILHLVGFDHISESEANAMESREILILKRMGIANPYESS